MDAAKPPVVLGSWDGDYGIGSIGNTRDRTYISIVNIWL